MWDPEHEAMDPPVRRRLQLSRLQDVLGRSAEHSPFYRRRFRALAIRTEAIRSLRDLPALPLTEKADLRQHFPFGMFAAGAGEPVELHCSSGTTGSSTMAGYTRRDLDTWAEVMARTLTAGGVHAGDLMHNAYGYGLFTGGLGFHYGALRVGATVLPASSGSTARQVILLRDLQATVLACTPSYALHLAEVAAEQDGAPLALRVALLGAEPWSEGMREEIQRRLRLTATDCYGLSEIIGPGVAFECVEGRGALHVNEDHFLPEVIDPRTGQPLPDGEQGELVLTTLTKEATPLLRYRTGDLTALVHDSCPCGRTLVRMARVCGRTDDMLIIRGVNVFPSDVEAVLTSIPELLPHYQVVVDRRRAMDVLEVQVEARTSLSPASSRALGRRVAAAVRDRLGLAAVVTVLPPKRLPRSEGKALRVIDRRYLKGA